MKTKTLLLITAIFLNTAFVFAQPGTLDRTFNFDGKVFIAIGGYNDGANVVAVQKNGKILAAGYTQDAKGKSAFALVRYLTHGNVDRSFGNNGIVTTYFYSDNNSVANAMAIQNDGKIILAGFAKINHYNNAFAVSRYKTDGSLDSSFSLNGKTVTDIDSGDDKANAIAIQSDGKIIVAGYTTNHNYGNYYSNIDVALVRYLPNGMLDSSFGVNGKVITDYIGFGDFNHRHDADYCTSVSILPNGKILAGGYSEVFDGPTGFLIFRYNPDGGLDSSFGKQGLAFNGFSIADRSYSMSVLTNGKILLSGYSLSLHSFFTLVRYNRNGSLDSSFGQKGVVLLYFNYDDDFGKHAVVQPDGKIIIAGYAYLRKNADSSRIELMRCNENGTLDSSFGNAGVVQTNVQTRFNYYAGFAPAIVLQTNGKIIIAGNAQNKLCVLRYNGNKAGQNQIANYKPASAVTTSLYVFPNPVKDVLNLQNLSSSKKTISVIDLNGKVLQQFVTSNNSYSFNVKQLSPGIYFVRINDDGKISTMKFIKE